MAQYGASFKLPNGNVFVTPDASPLCLYRRMTLTSNYQSVTIPSGKPVMYFSRDADGISMAFRNSATELLVGPGNGVGYIFTIFTPSLPKYGMGIWNAEGQLILTNESRILTDLVKVGTPGNQGGIYIDQTLTGSYAIAPQLLGAIVGMGSASIYAATKYNGSTTRIYGKAAGQPPGAQGYINHGNIITAIKTDIYDQ